MYAIRSYYDRDARTPVIQPFRERPVIVAFLYLITALIFARPIAISVDALESRPVGSFFLGLLVFLLSVITSYSIHYTKLYDIK